MIFLLVCDFAKSGQIFMQAIQALLFLDCPIILLQHLVQILKFLKLIIKYNTILFTLFYSQEWRWCFAKTRNKPEQCSNTP